MESFPCVTETGRKMSFCLNLIEAELPSLTVRPGWGFTSQNANLSNDRLLFADLTREAILSYDHIIFLSYSVV